MNVSLVTYGSAAVAFLLLSTLLLAQWRVRPLGPALLMATGITATWAGLIAIGTLYTYPPIFAIQVAELARGCFWLFFLFQLMGFQNDGDVWRWLGFNWLVPAGALVILGIGTLGLQFFDPLRQSASDLLLCLWLALSVMGLLLVEQVYRNASTSERWGLKYLCLGLGSMYVYDLFMYAEALLFRQLNAPVWQARGIANTLAVPWLAISIARNRHWRMNLYVSRHVVFHTVTLLGTGIYLLCMAAIGYFIKYLGGSWGGVIQVGFLSLAIGLLFALLFSANLQARLRVLLSKHFFSYRYDYREEWLRFTQSLSSLDRTDAGEGIIRAMASIALSKSGALYHRDSDGTLSARASWEMSAPEGVDLENTIEWISETDWIIDLPEFRLSPDIYEELKLPSWLANSPDLWLVVPLVFQTKLEGLLLLTRTDLKSHLNWEDRDLLKTAGRQAAALLAQHRASKELVEARQFDAFNRLSAYVIHDLKNILAQQSLMVSNAAKHRDNPAFIDDMISTIENSVRRMQRLMDQMRSGMRNAAAIPVDLASLLEDITASRSRSQPSPILTLDKDATILADKERLGTVFSHLIQNAQEATSDDGAVSVNLNCDESYARVTISDTGCGMSPAFIQTRLFQPFDSTKGLTGMGIGAFESREYVRQLDGDIIVTSEPEGGSEFVVILPLGNTS